jgi:hypothetical protein
MAKQAGKFFCGRDRESLAFSRIATAATRDSVFAGFLSSPCRRLYRYPGLSTLLRLWRPTGRDASKFGFRATSARQKRPKAVRFGQTWLLAVRNAGQTETSGAVPEENYK